MPTLTASPPLSAATPSASAHARDATRMIAVIAGAVLAAFGGYSAWVIATRGYLTFLEISVSNRWSLQILLDLVIAGWFALGWMRADARKRGIELWPYVVLVIPLGSIGLLLYTVRRAFAPPVTPRRGT